MSGLIPRDTTLVFIGRCFCIIDLAQVLHTINSSWEFKWWISLSLKASSSNIGSAILLPCPTDCANENWWKIVKEGACISKKDWLLIAPCT